MKSDNFILNANDGTGLFVYRWLPDDYNTVKAAVHIIHGMGEHAGRYREFARHLTEAGYAVYAMDQRGHGRTAVNPEEFGHYSDANGWFIVSATSPKLPGYFGILVSKYLIKKHGPRTKSQLHLKLTFDRYNSFFKPCRTESDWVSREISLPGLT